MTTAQSSNTIFKRSLSRCLREDTRLLIGLAGEKSWCVPSALALLAQARALVVPDSTDSAQMRTTITPLAPFLDQVVWVADDLPALNAPNLQHVHRAQAQRLLGSETTAAVIDAHDGLNANTMAAVTGTLCGGGLFILLTPPLDAWPNHNDPDYQRMAQAGAFGHRLAPAESSLFITRMVSLLRAQAATRQNILVFEQNDDAAVHEFLNDSAQAEPPPAAVSVGAVVEVTPATTTALDPTAGQQQFRDAAASLCQRSSGSLLLTAARGRGKSTALAFAVFDALLQTSLNVVVVAPHRANVAIFFSTLQSLCSALPATAIGRVSYRPADALLQQAYAGQVGDQTNQAKPLLVVDEAAGLALSLLDKLESHFPRRILASTTQGYEGSGRGLLLRFAQRRISTSNGENRDHCAGHTARDSQPQRADYFEQLSLTQPIRWAEGDQLESFIARLLCLADSSERVPGVAASKLAAPNLEKTAPAKPLFSKLVYVKLDKTALLHSESLLQNAYGMLVEAHYQTQPNDLRFMLDTPYSHLWLACDACEPDRVAGVLLAVEEGGMPDGDELTAAIVAGKRRPRGNLVAQRLANFSGDPSWCTQRSVRVMRIAVAPAQRRRGVARHLLQNMGAWAGAHDIAFWSSSFGFREELARFWQSVDALPVYLGMHIDKSSGARNLMVVNPLSSEQMAVRAARAAANLAADLGHWYPRFMVEFSDGECGAIARWATRAAQSAMGVDARARCGDRAWPCELQTSDLQTCKLQNCDLTIVARFAAGELDIAAVLPALARLATRRSATGPAAANAQPADWPKELDDYIAWAPDWRALAARTGVPGQAALSQELKRICSTLVPTPAS